jgi:hypothetical protein
MAGDIHTTAINRRGKFFRLIDDNILRFSKMLDINLNPTENPDECILAVYQLPDGEFRGVDLRLFHEAEWNEVAQ